MIMRHAVRTSTFLFSVGFHAALFGGLYCFSAQGDTVPEEQVYHVALAELAVPAPAPAAPPAPAAEPVPPPASEPEPVPPIPEPEVKPEPKKEPPQTPKISPRKKKETAAPRKAKTPPPPPAAPRPAALPQAVSEAPASGHASGTPRPSRIGGLMAYETDDVDQRPSVVKNARVEYPRKARRLGLSGRVVVQLVVDTEGKPQSCKIRSAEPTGHFEEAALSAARGMRFIPGKIQGRPVNTVVLIPFNFSLR